MCRGLVNSSHTMYICEINSDDECDDVVSHTPSIEYGTHRTDEQRRSPSFASEVKYAHESASSGSPMPSFAAASQQPPLRAYTSCGSLGASRSADWEGNGRIRRNQPYPSRELLHNKSHPLGTMQSNEVLASPRNGDRFERYQQCAATATPDFQRRNSYSHSSEYAEQQQQQQQQQLHHAHMSSRPRSPMSQVPSWCSDESDRQSSSTGTSPASPLVHGSPSSGRLFTGATPLPTRRLTKHSVDDILDATACKMQSSLVLSDTVATVMEEEGEDTGMGATCNTPPLRVPSPPPRAQPQQQPLPQQPNSWQRAPSVAPRTTRSRAVSDSERRIRNIGSPNTPYQGGYGHRQSAASRFAQPYHYNSPGSLPRSLSRCASASLSDSGVAAERRHHLLKGYNNGDKDPHRQPQPLAMFLEEFSGREPEETRSPSPNNARLDRLDSMHEITATLERSLVDAAKTGFSVPTISNSHRSLFFEAFAGIL